MRIELPISKSIANRWLMLQAIHGDELMPVSDSMPDDVQLLHHALTTLKTFRTSETISTPHLDVANCGTAMRFLTAYCAQLEGQTTILDGVERMHHRPIGQLVNALRSIGANIEYLGEEGFPPLRITGKALDKSQPITLNNPQSTQFVSALLLIGANVQTNSTSPYITLTRSLIEQYTLASSPYRLSPLALEKDWSAAAFWYEYVALHGGEIMLPGLSRDSLQGDKVVAGIFTYLGVRTTYTPEGITISKDTASGKEYNNSIFAEARQEVDYRATLLTNNVVDIVVNKCTLSIDFSACPDLYPAVALTCERLGITLHATGVESLLLKESDRLRAVAEHRTDSDHRMAMALLIAGYEVDDTACISKSYPQFLEQFHQLQHP